jgi:hypothetical protein
MSDSIHSCGYHCDRPACIKAQRDHLHAENERLREAAQKALGALNGLLCAPVYGYDDSTEGKRRRTSKQVARKAIDALREALK